VIVLAALTVSCAPSVANGTRASAGVESQDDRSRTLNHVTPARDFVGSAPTRFVWTAYTSAETYSIGVWTDVDVLVWRQDNVQTTSVAKPDDVRFEPGTYFWSVSALREGRLVAESGLAAFVVR
jgi:hypothetical protein